MSHSLRKLRRNTRQLRDHNHALRMTIDDLNRQVNKLRDSYAGAVKETRRMESLFDHAYRHNVDLLLILYHPLHRLASWIIERIHAARSLALTFKR